jgi:hypothetical protein
MDDGLTPLFSFFVTSPTVSLTTSPGAERHLLILLFIQNKKKNFLSVLEFMD